MSNVTTAVFGCARSTCTAPLWQYDYGQILKIIGPELPAAYEVHFSNVQHGEAKTQIGTADGVAIPDEFLLNGGDVYAWIYLHTGESDGETEYMITIPVKPRAKPSDDPPTPEEQSAITQALAALHAGVEHVDAIAGGMGNFVKVSIVNDFLTFTKGDET